MLVYEKTGFKILHYIIIGSANSMHAINDAALWLFTPFERYAIVYTLGLLRKGLSKIRGRREC